jgi:putative transcriptional regulator
VAQAGQRFRVFVGHAGWGGGQLEGELEQGAWLTTPATADFIFYEDTDLWEKVAKDIGKSLLQSMLKINEVPDDPSVN